MWAVNYTKLRHYHVMAEPSGFGATIHYNIKYDYSHFENELVISYHETELEAIRVLSQYCNDYAQKYLKRESELSKRIKELTTEQPLCRIKK